MDDIIEKIAYLFRLYDTDGIDRRDLFVDGSTLISEVATDDLSHVELVLALEDQFGVSIDQETADQLTTVGDIADMLLERSPRMTAH